MNYDIANEQKVLRRWGCIAMALIAKQGFAMNRESRLITKRGFDFLVFKYPLKYLLVV